MVKSDNEASNAGNGADGIRQASLLTSRSPGKGSCTPGVMPWKEKEVKKYQAEELLVSILRDVGIKETKPVRAIKELLVPVVPSSTIFLKTRGE